MSQTASTVVETVACVNSVSRTAKTARTEWSAVRRTHERLEALCASEETEVAEERQRPRAYTGARVSLLASEMFYFPLEHIVFSGGLA